MAAKRDRILEFVNEWRKEHPGEPLKAFLAGNRHVWPEWRSRPLRDLRSWLAEFESKKTALEKEFPHLKSGFCSLYSDRQEDWQYNLCNIVIPRLRLEVNRRERTGTPPKENITSNDSVSSGQPEFTHLPNYRSVTHRGKQHSLTERQAQMIQILHKAYQSGHTDVPGAHIQEQLGTPGSRWQDTWKSRPQARKALIAFGANKGTLRLNL